MKKASLIIQDIQNKVYNDTFLDIYVDQEQFIAHLEEARFVGIILIINMVKF